MACGIAGLSVAADSLSAIRYAKVRPVSDERGVIVDYEIEGEFPTYGNDDDRADSIAVQLVETFMAKVRQHPTYRDAVPTQSVLTITSNVVYGKHTGATPDGRRAGEPFAPGANPMNGRDRHGLVASALSVAKLPVRRGRGRHLAHHLGHCRRRSGARREERIANLVGILDGYIGVRRLPHERQRAGPRDARGRDGAPGALPAADDPRLRLRRQLRPADRGAAARRPQPHVPRRM